MKLTILQVPYDSGHYGVRMGGGPLRLVEQGLLGWLEQAGHEVELVPVVLDGFLTEVTAAPRLHRLVSKGVAAATEAGRLPIVLSGNCNTAAVGTLSGISAAGPAGVVWFDAHGDLNTPETSPSGFFDGMAISVAMGRAWRPLTASVPGFQPLDDRNLIHVGARDLDPAEVEVIESSPMTRVQVEELRRRGADGALGPALQEISSRVEQVYVHIDLDVLDPSELTANCFAVPGGLMVAEVEDVVRTTASRLRIGGVGITAYDPDQDPDGRAVGFAQRLLAAITYPPGSPGK